MTATHLCQCGDLCGESALWVDGALFWVDNRRNLIHQCDTESLTVQTWRFTETVAAIVATDSPGVLCVVLGSHAVLWTPVGDLRKFYGLDLTTWPEVRYNEAGAAPDGTLWLGSMYNNLTPEGKKRPVIAREGSLFRRHKAGYCETVLSDIGVANTLAWNSDGVRLYTADSQDNALWSYALERGTHRLFDKRPVLVDFSRGWPDGSAVDEEGCIWNCRYGGGCVVRVTALGVVQQIVELPAGNVTSCAFGGDDMRTLYITTAAADHNESPLAGGVFSVRTEVRGAVTHRHQIT